MSSKYDQEGGVMSLSKTWEDRNNGAAAGLGTLLRIFGCMSWRDVYFLGNVLIPYPYGLRREVEMSRWRQEVSLRDLY